MISELTLVVLAQCDTELHVTPSSPRKPRAEATRDWLKVEPISFNQLKSERVGNEPLFSVFSLFGHQISWSKSGP
jgi:hypothetical protein